MSSVNKHISLLALTVLLLFFTSCKKEPAGSNFVPEDEITASETHLIPDKNKKVVTTILDFKNINSIAYLSVNKSGGDHYSDKIVREKISAGYPFIYAIQKTDPESFKLILTAHYKDGNVSNPLTLEVDNRWGFFIRRVRRIARVTGRPVGVERFPGPNNTAKRWNVGGTDLGIVWEMDPGKYGVFFGDTFGQDFSPNQANPGPNGGSWRSNVLAFSEDTELDDGLTFNSMAEDNNGNAREIIYGAKDQSGNGELTSIPTAAIRANGVDYVHYFNIKTWTGWITNYSGLYKSADNGQTWTKCAGISFSANSHFGQGGYFKKDGYVYMIGTQTGRDGMAHLARFRESDIENKNNYEFWNGPEGRWIKGQEDRATVIIQDKVGELSFIYNQTLKKWVIAYFNGDRYNITMRTAEVITGPWSKPYELAAGKDYAQLYGSYLHPVSTSGEALYFLMSMWLPYNVFLMKAELADMGEF